MPPIPCTHCGVNFMQVTNDPHSKKLCNNCLVREEKRNPAKEATKMDTVDILIKCPRETQIKIEEYCINSGIDFSKYFLSLHDFFGKTMDDNVEKEVKINTVRNEKDANEDKNSKKIKGNKK